MKLALCIAALQAKGYVFCHKCKNYWLFSTEECPHEQVKKASKKKSPTIGEYLAEFGYARRK